LRYDFQRVETAADVSEGADDDFEDDFGPAMVKE
jgi:hypothetical protein